MSDAYFAEAFNLQSLMEAAVQCWVREALNAASSFHHGRLTATAPIITADAGLTSVSVNLVFVPSMREQSSFVAWAKNMKGLAAAYA